MLSWLYLLSFVKLVLVKQASHATHEGNRNGSVSHPKETIYNAVRRFDKVQFDTLRLSHKVVAQKENGSVKFGHENGSDYLFDTDIYIWMVRPRSGINGVSYYLIFFLFRILS